MTDEQINIAIAESIGYKAVRDSYGHWDLTHPAIGIEVKGWFAREDAYRDAPNYTASLDACAEFEAKITSNAERSEYVWCLNSIHPTADIHSPDECGRDYLKDLQLEVFDIATCTPRQRCEAYLRTIGKWTPSNQQPT